jgi:hypothetical protein
MDNKGPQITWVEQPQPVEDELEEELFFLDLNMSCLKTEERAKPYFQEMELRKKEIEMKLKLIKMEKDF